MALFTTEIEKKSVLDDSLIESSLEEDFVICKNPEKLNRLIKKIGNNKSIHYVSDGDWSMHDLVMQLLKSYNPAEIFITTYALRELPVRQLIMAQHDGLISSIKMLLDCRAKVRTPEVFQLASANLNSIFLTSIHAKVTVLKSEAASITIIGSANWTSNPRIECGIVCNDERVSNFHIDWINKISKNAEIFV